MDRSWMPTVAGILDIVSGGMALIGCLVLIFCAVIVGNVPPSGEEFPFGLVEGFLGSIALMLLLFAVIAVIGGVFALRGRGWGWALAGSIAATFACPPLGVPAIILSVLAEPELHPSA